MIELQSGQIEFSPNASCEDSVGQLGGMQVWSGLI